jgi:hypothetical protein
MVRDLGMSVGDICRWLYILGRCSVLTSRLWQGRCEDIGLQMQKTGGWPKVYLRHAGTGVMEMIGREMGCALRTTGFVCIYSLFVSMPFSFHVRFFPKDVPKSGDSRSITDTSPWMIRLARPSPIDTGLVL